MCFVDTHLQLNGSITDEIALSGYSALELLQGCNDKKEMRKVEKILQQISVYWLTENGCQYSMKLFSQLRLRTHIGMIDVLVGQTAVELHLPLHTFNKKHYRAIPKLITVQPYKRGK